MEDLTIGGFARWLPLDFDLEPDAYVEQLVGEFPTDPAAAHVAPGIVGMALKMARARDEGATSQTQALAFAWLLLASDDLLDPVAHATLQSLPLPTGRATKDLLTELISAQEVHGEPEWRSVDTASGPATFLRYRVRVETADELAIHERVTVAWARPDHEALVLLTGYTDDLVAGLDLAPALEQLAVTVEGL